MYILLIYLNLAVIIQSTRVRTGTAVVPRAQVTVFTVYVTVFKCFIYLFTWLNL